MLIRVLKLFRMINIMRYNSTKNHQNQNVRKLFSLLKN